MISESYNSYIESALALCSAGLAMTLTNPVDLVRIRMQTMNELVVLGKLNEHYSGLIDCTKRIQCEEGLKAFWKGNGAKLMRFYSSESINYFSKEALRKQIRNKLTKSNSFVINSMSGVIGSWISLSLLYPIEHARNCLSNSIGPNKKTVFGSIQNTFQKGGIRALYTGSSVSMFGVGIFRGTNFGIFDTYKKRRQGLERWSLAYLSSLIAIILTYPSDTIRRRMICAQKNTKKYVGFFDCLVKVYKSEGAASLFKGGPVIFFQSLSSSCVLYIYDKLGSEMKRKH